MGKLWALPQQGENRSGLIWVGRELSHMGRYLDSQNQGTNPNPLFPPFKICTASATPNWALTSTINKNKRKPPPQTLYPPHLPFAYHRASIIHSRLGGEQPQQRKQDRALGCYQAFPSKPLLKFPSNSPAHSPLSRWALSLMPCQQQLALCLLKTKMTD